MALERLKTSLSSLIPAVLAASLILITTQSAGAAGAAPPGLIQIGEVASVAGLVEVSYSGPLPWSPAGAGTPLKKGDRVRTGPDGRAMIDLVDGSMLSMGNDSEIEITEFLLKESERSAVYTLSRGKLRTFIREFSGKTDIRVRTPTSVSGVKGTDFLILNRGSANVFFGKTGTVAVEGVRGGGGSEKASGTDGERAVSLTAGVMTENTRGTSPIPPVIVEPGSELDLALSHLEAVTDVDAPVEWEEAGRLPMILARWNINYGAYLVDSGAFASALDVFQIAIDLTDSSAQKAEAHLGRGSVLARNVGDNTGALAEYMAVVERYPEEPFIENALYLAAVVSAELGDTEGALSLFRRYLDDYPNGSHGESVETFLRGIERAMED